MAGGNLKNMFVALLVPLPSILFYLSFVRAGGDTGASTLSSWCAAHPLLLANILFFLNVDVLFWLVGLLLSNHWVSKHSLVVSFSSTSGHFLVGFTSSCHPHGFCHPVSTANTLARKVFDAMPCLLDLCLLYHHQLCSSLTCTGPSSL